MMRLLLTLLLATSLSGCAMRNWLFPPAPFSDRSPCAISPTITKEQLVTHLNKNIQGTTTAAGVTSGVASWRSSSVKISATGMPAGFSVPASIAVEAPRNLRLRVFAPFGGGEELDMGSNPQQFWFWAKEARPQQVITVSHEDLPAAQRQLHMPFDPDWLMEVLGVIPIDGQKYVLKHGRADRPTLDLVSESISPAGEAIKKVIRVDACHGIIREHALYDSRGNLIARAALADHRIDQATGIVVPHVVSFDWPAMQQTMRMVVGTVELNPPPMPATAWQVPDKPNAPRFDLSQLLGGGGLAPATFHGARSPFGILPPPESMPIERASRTGVPSSAGTPTTFVNDSNWADDPAPRNSSTGVSRTHITRRALIPSVSERR